MERQLEIAVKLAVEAHKDQKYGDVPYIIHLYEVDRMVIHAYADKNRSHCDPYSKEPGDEMDCLRAVAYLHDIIEDTPTSFDDLKLAGICEKVSQAVLYITKTEGETYKDYISGVKSNELARKVKLCDTSANLMNSIKDGNVKRINKYSKQIQLLGGF